MTDKQVYPRMAEGVMYCMQSVYARTIYRPSDILFNRRYQVCHLLHYKVSMGQHAVS